MLALTLVALAVAHPPSAVAAPASSRCPVVPAQQESTPATEEDGTSELSRDDPIRVVFDGHRGMTDKAVIVSATPGLPRETTVIAEVESDFERGDGGDTFPLEAIAVAARVTTAGNVRLAVCLDSDRPEHVQTGRYLGSIRLTGPGIASTALPVEVTLKDSAASALLWIMLGLVLGLCFKIATDFKAQDQKLSRNAVKDYVTQPAFLLAVLTGVAASFIAYTQLYASNAVWGSTDDHTKLMLAGVAVQVTGMTASDLISPYVPGRGMSGRSESGTRIAEPPEKPAAPTS